MFLVTSRAFRKKVYAYYKQHGRRLPWRQTRDPYRILVSELMLQQTQAGRVIPKFKEFIKRFPSFKKLAEAQQSDVVRAWQGLGYNRRALYLHQTAKIIVQKHKGIIPKDTALLCELPGIGPYTASALRVFIWNIPDIVIETNIRTSYLYAFFPKERTGKNKQKKISDKILLPLIESTMDRVNPRKWYSALMDYGSMLKCTFGNESRRSAHYQKQSAFNGSLRQIRGQIIKALSAQGALSLKELRQLSECEKKRFNTVISGLVKEGFLLENEGYFSLK